MGLAKVLIVEDDAFARSMIDSALSNAGFEVLAVSNASSAMASAKTFNPNCALLDIDLGIGPTGVDLAHALRELRPNIGVVFLTSYLDYRLSKAGELSLPAGTKYLTKNAIGNSSKLASTLLSASINPLGKSSGAVVRLPLNQHQIKTMRLVANGFTNQEIARQMQTSEKAVEHVLSRILQKLGIVKDPKLNPRIQLVHAYSELSGRPVPK